MAGIGVKLDKIYEKNTLITTLSGMSYSTVVTIAPMVIVIGAIFAMMKLLQFDKLEYSERELFSCTVLYIFVFALIATSVLNAVVSRYIADKIFEDEYGAIMPCFYFCLVLTLIIGLVPAFIFFVHEYVVGKVDPVFILFSFIGYVALIFVFHAMQFLNICKEYEKITLFYLIGMVLGVVSALLINMMIHHVIYSMLLGVDIALILVCVLEYAQLIKFFPVNDHQYTKVCGHFKTYWSLIISNTLYILGLYAHNFVYWTSEMRVVVRESFVCAEPYDMATFLALITNISASVIFITAVERRFSGKYRIYVEKLIGGRLDDIETAKNRMFRQIGVELLGLVRIQFIISVALFLIFIVVLPQIGISGFIMQMYPCLAAGYFILFLMYGGMVFLYYYNDLLGAILTSATFLVTELVVTLIVRNYTNVWYGLGVVLGASLGFVICYIRLRWVERNIDRHIFCEGNIKPYGKGQKPSNRVYIKS